jgi:hypothetical protein
MEKAEALGKYIWLLNLLWYSVVEYKNAEDAKVAIESLH